MKKRTIRILTLVILLSLFLSMAASASVNASEYIAITSTWLTRDSNDPNTVKINFYIVGTTSSMDQIGAKWILLYERDGNTWNLVKDFECTDPLYASTLMRANSSAHVGYVTYAGSASKQYYAAVRFYSEKDGGSDYFDQETPIG